MTRVNRREREKEEMKELILNAASEIIAKEGFEKLSIRKIAKIIEYSPSIIYHYFKDKEEILNYVMQRGYRKIVNSVSFSSVNNLTPEEKLRTMTKNYIYEALKMPDEFLAAQLNKSPEALKHTSSLFAGASKEKPALNYLYNCLKEIYNEEVEDSYLELTAQMIVVSSLGLIIKLIIEKNIDEKQKERLINFFIDETVLKIAKKNS